MSLDSNTSKRTIMEITDWDELVEYVQFLNRSNRQNVKICSIDEEEEEIQIDSKEEFRTSVEYARNRGIKSLRFLVYFDDELKIEGIFHIEKTSNDVVTNTVFPVNDLENLRKNVLGEKWYIPVKRNEPLGRCLTSSISIIEQGILEKNFECQEFLDTIVPEAFRKLQTTQSVFTWPRSIHEGIFELLELLIDLISVRLRHQPVPVILLNTLALCFDVNTPFSQKHKTDLIPTDRISKSNDDSFLQPRLNKPKETFGWIRSILQRFIAQGGLEKICSQFEYLKNNESKNFLTEYNSLVKVFAKCHQLVNGDRFREIFTPFVQQSIRFLLEAKRKNSNPINVELHNLNESLIEICFNYEMSDEVTELLQLKPVVPTTPIEPVPEITKVLSLKERKQRKQDCYERLAECVKKLRVNLDEANQQKSVPLFNSTDSFNNSEEQFSSLNKRESKKKHHKEQQLINTHSQKKEKRRANTIAVKTYDRTDSCDVLRFFGPMRIKIAELYDDLQTATSQGDLRQVLKIEEKLKLINPYSARFVADETMPDGTRMQPGERFCKVWRLLNDGSMPWTNDDIQLINLYNEIDITHSPTIPVVAPHEQGFVSVNFICPQKVGIYESKWILSNRQRTFGPIIWCSIEVVAPTEDEPLIDVKEEFQLIDVPLPDCFDLSKPFEPRRKISPSESTYTSLRSPSLISSEFDEPRLIEIGSDDRSTITASLPGDGNIAPLIELTEMSLSDDREEQHQGSNESSHFVDSVVSNIFSVAKQAGSTAKAIFNTLQAVDETPVSVPPPRPTTPISDLDDDDYFEHLESNGTVDPNSSLSKDPVELLVEMGFVDRAKNRRLLNENHDDVHRVVEILVSQSEIDTNWAVRFH